MYRGEWEWDGLTADLQKTQTWFFSRSRPGLQVRSSSWYSIRTNISSTGCQTTDQSHIIQKDAIYCDNL